MPRARPVVAAVVAVMALGCTQAVASPPLGPALGPDGTISVARGSYDARGWTMSTDGGVPRFTRSAPLAAGGTDALWSDRFGIVGLPTASRLYAVAVANGDVYVGGLFTALNNKGPQVAANNVARWNGRGWSSLGAGAANGTNGEVRAIALSGATVYVGGKFTSAGGAPAAHVARWDGSAWWPLGDGVTMTPVSGQVRS